MRACFQEKYWGIGLYRDDFWIWGCEGGYAAFTPPNPDISTAIPKEPRYSNAIVFLKHIRRNKSPSRSRPNLRLACKTKTRPLDETGFLQYSENCQPTTVNG
jgi:hypothetical protein